MSSDRSCGWKLVYIWIAYAAGATFEKVDETLDGCGADSKPAHSTSARRNACVRLNNEQREFVRHPQERSVSEVKDLARSTDFT